MTTELSIISQQYNTFDTDDIDHMLKANEALESEVKRLRKEKDQLLEQLSLLKKFSDGLWDRLKVSI